MPTFNNYFDNINSEMDIVIEKLESELTKVRTGKANPSLFNSVFVECYGSKMPLPQVATVNTLDARTLIIKPFDKSTLPDIVKAITIANLGFNPMDEGDLIRIVIPPLTEERRKELSKTAKSIGEQFKVTVRNHRKDALDVLKKSKTEDSLSEDIVKDYEAEIQKLTNTHITEIDTIIEKKHKEILTV